MNDIKRQIYKYTKKHTQKKKGEKWMIRGPLEYVPPVEVTVIRKVQSIPLDKNEGIYVRNLKTGAVRTVIGKTYMLKDHEVLYEKELPAPIEELFAKADGKLDDNKPNTDLKSLMNMRDKTRVITYRVPHNCACQVYDYKSGEPRIVFGPNLIMLQPEEMITPLSLSGGKPKVPNLM